MAEIPQGFAGEPSPVRELFAYLCVNDAPAALAFYREVFGARELARVEGDDGRIGHAELAFGPAVVMLADEHPEVEFLSPGTVGGTPVRIHIHVDDVDTLARRAEAAGARILRGPRDESHGERQCRVQDPFGHVWLLGEGSGG